MTNFDLTGPLPTGTTVLEASAGTGKSYSIAALATRYLAEGVVPVTQLMIVTFSRVATQHLRSQVRERLTGSARLLASALTEAGAGDRLALERDLDAVERHLLAGDPEELRRRLDRVEDALNDFDQATIMTTHEFCHGMMRGLGMLARTEPPPQFVEDVSPLVREVARDVFLARYAHSSTPPVLPFAPLADWSPAFGALEMVRSAMTGPDARLAPQDAPGSAGERCAFAEQVWGQLERRKESLGWYTFDDLLSRLADSLSDSDLGPLACARLRERFRVVLVDEFQDTDPVQWEILRRAFAGHVTLVLIGDPKQAIYSFRGADVNAYRAAVESAPQPRSTLAVNYRADQGVVVAVTSLFGSALLGEGIEVPPVAAYRLTKRLVAPTGSPWLSPLRIRTFRSAEPVGVSTSRKVITSDVVGQVTDLLSGGILLDRPEGACTRVKPPDIAILVRRNDRGRELASALTEAGIPAAFSGAESVFSSQAAKDWLTLLTALSQPGTRRLRAAMLTPFVGATFAELATASDQQLADWAGLVRGWAKTLGSHGVAALFAAIMAESGMAGRVLSHFGGDRLMTDYRHLAELLHDLAVRQGMGAGELLTWLREAVAESDQQSDRVRRLETDSETVQVMTIHRSKGLEFPIVLLPDVADHHPKQDDGQNITVHTERGRIVDVGGRGSPGRAERYRQFLAEEGDDALRTLYVALTRGQSQVTCWWADTKRNTHTSALNRLLFRDRATPGVPALSYPADPDERLGDPADLEWLAPAGIAVEPVAPAAPVRAASTPVPVPALECRTWTRRIDPEWRRTSYSGLTAGVHAEAPSTLIVDEPDLEAPTNLAASDLLRLPSPMRGLPGGTAFGTFVHTVLEGFQGRGDPLTELEGLCTRALARFPLTGVSAPEAARALLPSVTTPLGPLAADHTLSDLPDRLRELDFELPLGHGEAGATLTEVARHLERHLPADDPLAGYPAQLSDLAATALRGYLTGSIDAVLRIPGPSPRFVVVDYKTNRLGPEADLALGHYTQAAMAEAMMASHYPLQAILYSVVLHRFLAQRLRGYDPRQHLGGVLYLFVRGLGGPGSPESPDGGPGVFSWNPQPQLITGLSQLLAHGVGAAR